MAADPDGDSQMGSSPEGSQSGSRTPTNPSQLPSQFPGSELSPPGSQTQNTTVDMEGVAGKETTAGDTTMASAPGQKQPGAPWMNRRAEEEYQRAMEYVIDQDFSLDEFGDPFDDTDMEQKLF